MEDLKSAVAAVEAARAKRDAAKAAFDAAEITYDKAIVAARDAHAELMKWLSESVPGIGAARREL